MEPNTPEQTPNPKRKPSPAISPRNIEEGFGDKLKDIPNVFEKLSKAGDDENMQFPHKLLYGTKKAKNSWTENILEFSGVVGDGPDDLEREMKNVKEKLAKCPDSQLLYLCNVLDIPGASGMSKHDMVFALVEFLEFPWQSDDSESSENAEDDSERTISKERSSDPKTDAENQESVQNKDEVEDGDYEEEGDQSESAHENDKPKGEDELEDGGDEEGDQSEFAHENDQPKDEDELEDGGDEEEADQSESAHENNEPKYVEEEDRTEAESEPEENPLVENGSTSSK